MSAISPRSIFPPSSARRRYFYLGNAIWFHRIGHAMGDAKKKLMRIKQQGAGAVELFLWASSWYGARPDPQLSPAARLSAAGNAFYVTAPDAKPATERLFFTEVPTDAPLAKLSHALDDLRRLGEADLRFNHPSHWR